MRIDEDRMAGVVLGFREAGQMDFSDMLEGEGGQVGARVETMIGRRDQDVAHVEQQAAAGPSRDLADEFGLGNRAFPENHIGRGVFEQHAAPERLLRLIDVVAHFSQRFRRVGQRQQVVEIAVVMAGPGQMLGKKARLVALGEGGQAPEMLAIERPRRADRQADAVQRQWVQVRIASSRRWGGPPAPM